MKIKKIDAYLSNIYKVENFSGIIKQIKKDRKWTRGGIIVADHKECIENSVLANKLFPNFFPKIISLSNETYLRNFINSKTLEENPKKLEKVLRIMSKFHQKGIKKIKNKKNIEINKLNELWKEGKKTLNKFSKTDNYKSLLTYNIGDAKASNLLADSKYLTFDSEGFSIGDISTDIISLIESYQFNKKPKLFKKTLEIVKKEYFKIDKNIVEKSLLGLIGIRMLETNIKNRDKKLLNEAIKFFNKFKNI
jgi:hypothetical protein